MHKATTTTPTLPVTAVQVSPIPEPLGKTVAMARITLADQFQVVGLRIVEGVNGLFVAYPNDPSYRSDDYSSLCYPTTRDLRDAIESAVITEYKRMEDV